MDPIVLLECVASADDVHIKYFYRRQPPTTADNPRLAYEVEFSSTSQASRRSMPGIDYDSAIMFTYAVTMSQAVPAAMSQVWRRSMVLELLLFPLLNSGTVYLFLSAHVTI